ncbi:MAG: hypothetical protein AAF658_17560, partial [Myxococcota bacterium]
MTVSIHDPATRAALERLHRLCVGHARGAREIAHDLRQQQMAVLPRARRLMLEARANLEQWRVAVLRIDALNDSEREMVEMLMSVARRDVESSYSMIAHEINGSSATQTLE